MTSQTKATQRIIARIQSGLEAACVTFPEVMLNCILEDAQELVAEGYVWDVALAMSAKSYPCTQYAGQHAYAA